MGENIISDNMGRKFSLCFPVPKKNHINFLLYKANL